MRKTTKTPGKMVYKNPILQFVCVPLVAAGCSLHAYYGGNGAFYLPALYSATSLATATF